MKTLGLKKAKFHQFLSKMVSSSLFWVLGFMQCFCQDCLSLEIYNRKLLGLERPQGDLFHRKLLTYFAFRNLVMMRKFVSVHWVARKTVSNTFDKSSSPTAAFFSPKKYYILFRRFCYGKKITISWIKDLLQKYLIISSQKVAMPPRNLNFILAEK